jgi:hypothetical protein
MSRRSVSGAWRGLGVSALAVIVASTVGASAVKADDSPYLNVWVHSDYTVGPDHSDAPSPAAIRMAVDAFRAHGVTLHIDPQHTAIPEQEAIVPDWPSGYARTPGIDDPSCTGPDAVRFSDLEARYFRPHGNHPWHYAVFGDYVFGDATLVFDCPSTVETDGRPPLPGMSGDSQVGFLDVPDGFGTGFVVALQGFRDAGIDLDAPANARVEAAVFMHELGHNLGLCHTGPDLPGMNCNVGGVFGGNPPNYISVMNYAYNFGIPFAATPGSTTIAGFRVDYSDLTLPDLDENCLDETVGMQDTAHPTDIAHTNGRVWPVFSRPECSSAAASRERSPTSATTCRPTRASRSRCRSARRQVRSPWSRRRAR